LTKNDFDVKVKNLGLKKTEFAELSNISYNTVKGWIKLEEVPGWVESWLDNYADSIKLKAIKEVLK
jgi:hypothetical protein